MAAAAVHPSHHDLLGKTVSLSQPQDALSRARDSGVKVSKKRKAPEAGKASGKAWSSTLKDKLAPLASVVQTKYTSAEVDEGGHRVDTTMDEAPEPDTEATEVHRPTEAEHIAEIINRAAEPPLRLPSIALELHHASGILASAWEVGHDNSVEKGLETSNRKIAALCESSWTGTPNQLVTRIKENEVSNSHGLISEAIAIHASMHKLHHERTGSCVDTCMALLGWLQRVEKQGLTPRKCLPGTKELFAQLIDSARAEISTDDHERLRSVLSPYIEGTKPTTFQCSIALQAYEPIETLLRPERKDENFKGLMVNIEEIDAHLRKYNKDVGIEDTGNVLPTTMLRQIVREREKESARMHESVERVDAALERVSFWEIVRKWSTVVPNPPKAKDRQHRDGKPAMTEEQIAEEHAQAGGPYGKGYSPPTQNSIGFPVRQVQKHDAGRQGHETVPKGSRSSKAGKGLKFPLVRENGECWFGKIIRIQTMMIAKHRRSRIIFNAGSEEYPVYGMLPGLTIDREHLDRFADQDQYHLDSKSDKKRFKRLLKEHPDKTCKDFGQVRDIVEMNGGSITRFRFEWYEEYTREGEEQFTFPTWSDLIDVMKRPAMLGFRKQGLELRDENALWALKCGHWGLHPDKWDEENEIGEKISEAEKVRFPWIFEELKAEDFPFPSQDEQEKYPWVIRRPLPQGRASYYAVAKRRERSKQGRGQDVGAQSNNIMQLRRDYVTKSGKEDKNARAIRSKQPVTEGSSETDEQQLSEDEYVEREGDTGEDDEDVDSLDEVRESDDE